MTDPDLAVKVGLKDNEYEPMAKGKKGKGKGKGKKGKGKKAKKQDSVVYEKSSSSSNGSKE